MKITFEGVTFDAEWAVSKSQKEFIQHESHHGLTADQLKEAHMLCKVASKKEPPAEQLSEPLP
jgi:hypothetical protein